MQKKLVAHKAGRRISAYFNFPGAACLAGGGIAYYLAQKDFDDAAAAKKILIEDARIQDDNRNRYDALVKENKDKNDAGALKTNAAYGLFGAGGVLVGVGLVLYF